MLEVARGIARGNVQATAKRDREMRKVTANADLLHVSLRRGAGGVRLLIIEPEPVVDVVNDRLDAVPTPPARTKKVPSKL